MELDNLAAETAATMTTKHPDYAILAARIAISNLHKETKKVFTGVFQCTKLAVAHSPLRPVSCTGDYSMEVTGPFWRVQKSLSSTTYLTTYIYIYIYGGISCNTIGPQWISEVTPNFYASAFRRQRHYVFGLSVRPSVRSLKYPLLTCTWVRWSTRPTVTVLRHVRPSVCLSVEVSGHLPENAWRKWPEILHADVS